MTQLTVTEYICRKCLLVCSVCRNHNPIFSSFIMIYHRICQKSNTLCSVSRVEQELLTLPQHMSSPPVLCAVRVAQSLVFCVMFCRSLSFCLVRFLLVIVCPFRCKVSGYPFGIFSFFLALVKMKAKCMDTVWLYWGQGCTLENQDQDCGIGLNWG